jgi:hypothetical protein
MKFHAFFFAAFVAIFMLSTCGSPIGGARSNSQGVVDQASLVEALRDAGVKVELQDTIQQEFFTPQAQLIGINAAGIQVYEYASEAEMEAEARLVAPDGGSIGTSMVNWVEPPHFFRTGRIIVLYLGSDAAILRLLESLLGPQFAGR